MNRREFLESIGLCAGAGWLIAACGPESASSDEAGHCSQNAADRPSSWVEVPLADHPALREVGGSIELDRPDDYLKAHVVHYREGCYLAASRLCTHGACELEVGEVDVVAESQEEGLFVCPCHGSRFGPDGRVVRGPAADPIASFDIQKTEESLWIKPPKIG